jgi:hypothetical protein
LADLTIVDEGRPRVDQAAAHDTNIRLLGGVAVWLRAGEQARALFGRRYPDLDFVVHKRQSRGFRTFLEELGYEPERTFNAMHGAKRLLYRSPDGSYQVDVFLDIFEMCHVLDFSERMEIEAPTLPAADLLLTKLQIAQVNRKDVSDVLMLLHDHQLTDRDGPQLLNAPYVARLCSADWGLYTTIGDNLDKVRELAPDIVPDVGVVAPLIARVDELRSLLEQSPKTKAWRLRATVGRRKRWYTVVEEVVR